MVGWMTHRNSFLAVAILSGIVLFDLASSLGVTVNSDILGTGIPWRYLLGAGMVYMTLALWKKYI